MLWQITFVFRHLRIGQSVRAHLSFQVDQGNGVVLGGFVECGYVLLSEPAEEAKHVRCACPDALLLGAGQMYTIPLRPNNPVELLDQR